MALAMAGFTLGIRPVASLRPHEEVIPRRVDQLASEMTRDGAQKDPIIIDRETATVLDGMHRLAAFQELGVEYAVCCAVDYSSPAVALGRWARVYALGAEGTVRAALDSLGGARRTTLAEAFTALGRRDAAFAVLTADAAFVSGDNPPQEGLVSSVQALDRLAEENRWERSFVPEDDVDVPLQQPRKLVLLIRRLTKEDVVSAARAGKLFPCKTSMHAVDPRPVAVGFPLSDLDKADTGRLKAKLGAKVGRLLPAGSSYEGRRYKERLLVLDQ